MATMRIKRLLFVLPAIVFLSCLSATFAKSDRSQSGQLGGQQQQLQHQLKQCKLSCTIQGQSPQLCAQRCMQQLSGGGISGGSIGPYSGTGGGSGSFGPYSGSGSTGRGLEPYPGSGSTGQGMGPYSSSGSIGGGMDKTSPGSGSGAGGLQMEVASSRQQQQLQKFLQCRRICQSQSQSPMQQQMCQTSCMQKFQQGGSGGGFSIAQVVEDVNPSGRPSLFKHCQELCYGRVPADRVIQCMRKCQEMYPEYPQGRGEFGGRSVSRWMVGFFLEE